MANGYSSAERRANVKKQLRDKKGRWIEMGGGVEFLYNGQLVSGKVSKIDTSTGNVTVEVTSGKSSGQTVGVNHKSVENISSKATIPSKGKKPGAKPAANVDTKTKKTTTSGTKKATLPDDSDGATPVTKTGEIKNADEGTTPEAWLDHWEFKEEKKDKKDKKGILSFDADTWKKTGGQKGSNAGGNYTAPDGKKYYVKFTPTDDHARNEALASELYEMAGVPAAKQHLLEMPDGKLAIASEMIDGAKPDLSTKRKDPAYLDKIQDGFAADAWLANWDTAGLEFDNMVSDKNGDPVRVDPGGALLYRAMGSPKGNAFNGDVTEWNTLRDGSNKQSTTLFGKMSDDKLASSASKVSAINDDDIVKAIEDKNFSPDTENKLKDTILARKAVIEQHQKDLSSSQGTDDSKADTSTPDAPAAPEEAPSAPVSNIKTDDGGNKYVPDANGDPIYEGSVVTSKKDGLTGKVKKIESNGNYVKIEGPDGKVKGRKINTLEVQNASTADEPVNEPEGDAPNVATLPAGTVVSVYNKKSKYATGPYASYRKEDDGSWSVFDDEEGDYVETAHTDSHVQSDLDMYANKPDTFAIGVDAPSVPEDDDDDAGVIIFDDDDVDIPKVADGEIGTFNGAQYVSDGDGNPIFEGDTVTSKKDGLTGTVVKVENNGKYVKVQGPDGKVKGRRTKTLEKQSSDAPQSSTQPAQQQTPQQTPVVDDDPLDMTPPPPDADDVEPDDLMAAGDYDSIAVSDAPGASELPVGAEIVDMNEVSIVKVGPNHWKGLNLNTNTYTLDQTDADVNKHISFMDDPAPEDGLGVSEIRVPKNVTKPSPESDIPDTTMLAKDYPTKKPSEMPIGTKYSMYGGSTTLTKIDDNKWSSASTGVIYEDKQLSGVFAFPSDDWTISVPNDSDSSNGPQSPQFDKSMATKDYPVGSVIEHKSPTNFITKLEKTDDNTWKRKAWIEGYAEPDKSKTLSDASVQLFLNGSKTDSTNTKVQLPGGSENSSSSAPMPTSDIPPVADIPAGGQISFDDTNNGGAYTYTKQSDGTWSPVAYNHNGEKSAEYDGVTGDSLQQTIKAISTGGPLSNIFDNVEYTPPAPGGNGNDAPTPSPTPSLPSVDAPPVPSGTIGTDSEGKKYVSDANGKPIYANSTTVMHPTKGYIGVVTKIEPNGTHVVMENNATGKKHGLKADKLNVLTPSASPQPNPYVPKAPATKIPPSTVDVGNVSFNENKFAGASADEYRKNDLTVGAVSYPDKSVDESNPLFGTKPPEAPTPPDGLDDPMVDDEWVGKVKQRYLDNPNKAKPNLEASNNWSKVQSVVSSGDTTSLDALKNGSYIDDELYNDAVSQIAANTSKKKAVQTKYDAQLKEFGSKHAEWSAVNGDDDFWPVGFSHMPEPSTEAFTGGDADWSKAHVGTVSLNNALSGIAADPALARKGLSVATDASSIEDTDLHLRHVKLPSGDKKLQARFKLTAAHGDALSKALGDKYASTIGIPSSKVDAEGYTVYTQNAKYTDLAYNRPGRRWNIDGDGYTITVQRDSKDSTAINQDALHNSVTIEFDTDATPEQISDALTKLGVKAKPASESDLRILAENKILSSLGGDTDPRRNAGAHRKAKLQEIEKTYGITPDDLVFAPTADGRNRVLLNDKAKNALKTKTGNTGFRHNMSTTDPEQLADILGGNGLMATHDRWAAGIATTGMSSSSDMGHGSGDYVFTKPMTSTPMSKPGTFAVVHPDAALRRTDIYGNASDSFGKRSATKNVMALVGDDYTYEIMFKHNIPVSELWYFNTNPVVKTKLIDALKKRGIVQINGIPLDKFIVVPGQELPTVPVNQWDIPVMNPGPSIAPGGA